MIGQVEIIIIIKKKLNKWGNKWASRSYVIWPGKCGSGYTDGRDYSCRKGLLGIHSGSSVTTLNHDKTYQKDQ